jgi:hypothetical protein
MMSNDQSSHGAGQKVDAANQRADRAEKRATLAEAGLASERARADGLETDRAVAQHDADSAQHAAAVLRLADERRKGLGLWRRAWRAWRGE